MRTSVMNAVVAIAAATVAGGSAFAAGQAYWRPVMPKVVVNVRVAEGAATTPELILIYGEEGSDPFRSGTLAPDNRISGCSTDNSVCVSPSARNEFRTEGARRQSLQVRLLNGRGNPIVGGVIWSGPAHPRRVDIKCDLRVADVHRSCTVTTIAA